MSEVIKAKNQPEYPPYLQNGQTLRKEIKQRSQPYIERFKLAAEIKEHISAEIAQFIEKHKQKADLAHSLEKIGRFLAISGHSYGKDSVSSAIVSSAIDTDQSRLMSELRNVFNDPNISTKE